MPLAQCPVCDKSISKRAYTCPGCGEPDPFNSKVKSKALGFVLWLVLIAVGAYAFWTYILPMMIEFVHDI
ncbi:hypothetical protein ACGRL8_07425 [Vibrio rumoiensis]|uniref:Uncharacterized protein n=1 Tax=Vibrio rumoiensis TaxID=76258 RepID=A0ABW7IWK5_9VIBR